MRTVKVTLLFVVISLFTTMLTAYPPVNSDGKSPFVEVVKNTRDAVVNIKVESEIKLRGRSYNSPFDDDFFKFFAPRIPNSRKSTQMGSGFIYKTDSKFAYIITNNHVVQTEGDITVSVGEKHKYKGEIVGRDPSTDLAVIKIERNSDVSLSMIPLGDSESLEIGDWAIAIGNPFGQLGLDRTVTVGVISAKGRSNLNFGSDSPVYQDYIQTDAAINPGNSGGPLVDIHGKVIGVNAAITSPAGGNVGIGFAIPVNLVKKVVNDIMDKGKVVRAYLGVLPQELNEDLGKMMKLDDLNGVLIAKVEDDTPADKAGLKKGDVITKIDGKAVENLAKFRIQIANKEVGKKVNLSIVREGKHKNIQVKLEEFPDNSVASTDNKADKNTSFGLEVVNSNSDTARRMGVQDLDGVVITRIEPESFAAASNLSVGDTILEINNSRIKDTKDFDKMIKKIENNYSGSLVLFHVVSKNGIYKFLTINIK